MQSRLTRAAVLVVGLALSTAACGRYSFSSLASSKDFQDGIKAYQKQDYRRAAEEFEGAVASNPDFPAAGFAYFYLGNSHDSLYKPARKGEAENDAHLQKAVEKWPVEIGVCVDTRHVLRTGENPIDWIKALGPRVHDVHLKDYSDAKTEHILGKGKLDVLGVLKALKEVKFSGILAIEDESNEKYPIADVKECLAAVREACRKL